MSHLEERLSIMHMIGSGYLPPEAGLDQLNVVSERTQKRVYKPEHSYPNRTVDWESMKTPPSIYYPE